MGSTNILLISYVFPPYYGIGGRRWARHAGELANLGYHVDVICAKNPFEEVSMWYDHVKNHENITIHELPTMFPNVLLKSKFNFFEKLQYRFWLATLRIICRGNYFDRSAFWKKEVLSKSEELIRRNSIKNIITTGGPFSVLYFAALLKKKMPHLNLISDFRDPWTSSETWGYSSLSERRLQYEKLKEKTVLTYSDLITVPTDSLKDVLANAYPEFQKKIKVVPHFYDEHEIVILPKTKSKKVRFILYGNLYRAASDRLKIIAKVFKKFSSQISLDVYSDTLLQKNELLRENNENIRVFDYLPPKELFLKFNEYDFVLLVYPDFAKDYISTKYYEIIYSRTPILIFSKSGMGSEFLVKHNLGIHADVDQLEETIKDIVLERLDFKYNDGYDVSDYSLSKITKDISYLLSF